MRPTRSNRRPRRVALYATASVILGAGLACTPRPPPTLHALAESYVRVSLQLAQHQPNLVEAWTGPAAWRQGARVPVEGLRTEVERLAAQADATSPAEIDPTEVPRLTYLRGQLRALTLVTRRLLGESTRFDEELRLGFGRGLPDNVAHQIAAARATLDRELAGPGTLAERYLTFRRQFVVPEARVDRVLAAAIDACRVATIGHVGLPENQRVDLEFDPSIGWDAYAEYLGDHHTRVKVSSRQGRDVARLLRLACHETYPGHHLQHVLIDDALVKGRTWIEFQMTPAFGPHLLVTEGAAEAGADLAFPEPARTALYRDRLLPLAGLLQLVEQAPRLARVEGLVRTLELGVPAIIGAYLDGVMPSASAIDALATQTLVPAPERFLAFAERHRAAAVVYPIGRMAITRWLEQDRADADRWRRLQDIFTRAPFALD